MEKTKQLMQVAIDLVNQYEEARPDGITTMEYLSFLDEVIRIPAAVALWPDVKNEIKTMTFAGKNEVLTFTDAQLKVANAEVKENILNAVDVALSGIRLITGISNKAA